jgi:hypothetical protein
MDAAKKLAKATYRYNDLDDRAKELERRYVPKAVKKHAAVLGVIVNLCFDQKLSFKWEF